MKKNKAVLILVAILACLGGLGYYASLVIAGTNAKDDNSIKLGLDLAGGVSITYQVVGDTPSEEDMSDTIYKLQKRVEDNSTEAQVYQEGEDRITVEIPGVTDANEILEELGKPGSLYFIEETDSDGNENYTYDATTGAYVLNYTIEELEEKGSIVCTGDDVKDAQAETTTDDMNNKEYVVSLAFTSDGTTAFAEATTKAYENDQSIGIYYDGAFISVPSVNTAITDGQAQITGQTTFEEADDLASTIRIGSLSLELEELQSNVVGAQLGGEAISTSLKAAGIGLILIMVFMTAMYLLPGFISAIALVGYVSLVLGALKLFDVTLTLPGIAGVILAIGMAVDANVIIFARIREEIAAGRTVKTAMETGFQKATSAIVDGNVTTFIAAVVLGIMGSGTVKGFAYTLGIGIVVSMFTALVVTRWIMKCLFTLGLKDPKFYGKQKERKTVDFLKSRKVFFGLSIAMVLSGFVALGVYQQKDGSILNYSLEFIGGTSTTVDFGEDYTIEEIESDIVPKVSEVTGDSNIQTQKVADSTKIIIKTRSLDLEERESLNTTLVDNFGVDESTIEAENISSTVSSEMRTDAVVAVIVATILMLIYIWFRFKDIRFAASAVIALLHDVLVVFAFYAIARVSVGNTFIACMLTIVGYSINATIVIFDRIRENLKTTRLKDNEAVKEIVNRSITQTLSRSINTSITTFVMVFMLYILGVTSIKEFAAPLMVGIICGAYSSVCITGALWFVMKTRINKK